MTKYSKINDIPFHSGVPLIPQLFQIYVSPHMNLRHLGGRLAGRYLHHCTQHGQETLAVFVHQKGLYPENKKMSGEYQLDVLVQNTCKIMHERYYVQKDLHFSFPDSMIP